MAYDEDTAWVLWPEYFDSSRSRAEGRRMPASKTVKKPNVDQIAEALEKLGYEYVIESEKSYPGNWWVKGGRVRVERIKPKTQIIAEVAKVLVRSQRS